MEIQVSPLTSGTIVKIYNSNRGQDYVIIGQSQNKLLMAKNSAITNDGSLFKQTKLYTIDMVPMFKETDPFYFVPKVKRVVGHRSLSAIKKEDLVTLVNATSRFYGEGIEGRVEIVDLLNTFELLKLKDEVYPGLDVPDIKKIVSY